MQDKFKYRSNKKELLDEPNIPRNLLFKNLRELDILNRTTGGHNISLKGIKQLINDRHKNYHIVDLGCGSGDLLKIIADWARLNKFSVRLTGVDKNNDAIDFLRRHCINYPEISAIALNYTDFLNKFESIDIVHSSLFCHHLTDEELIDLFIHFKTNIIDGFVINDLQRHRLAYYAAWISTRLLNGSSLAKNDGPVSVLRGFRYAELIALFKKANISNYTIQTEKAFRFLIVGKTEKYDEFTG